MHTPNDAPATVAVRARGVPDVVPFGGAALEWAIGWALHALCYRRQWAVEVTIRSGSSLTPLETLVVEARLPRARAVAVAVEFAARLRSSGVRCLHDRG